MATVKENHWPCDACGGDLRFAPGQTSLVCPYCGHTQAIPEAAAPKRVKALVEHDLQAGLSFDLPVSAMEDIRTLNCTNCGAQIEFASDAFAKTCPFCATPVVAQGGSHQQIKPQALVPFVLTETEARKAMVDWLGRLWFAPNGLVEYARKGRALTGIYVPFWTFDSDTRSKYTGARGTYYYTTKTVTVNVNGRSEQRQVQERHTRWAAVRGAVARRFDDLLILASKSLPTRLGDDLSPWDLTQLKPYSTDYIAGFLAEGYAVGLADGHAVARIRMEEQIREDVRRDIGGDEQRIDGVQTLWQDETFKHVLLPVWTAAYKFNNKSYTFLVNGQTGEVQGERPYSAWKIAFAVLLALIAVGLTAYFGDQFK